MSFDLFLVTFHNGGNATADAAAARVVLGRARYDHRPEFHAYDINFDDGSHVEMYAGGLDAGDKPFDGAMFALRGFSEAIGAFVFELARAAGCVIFPAMEPACVLLPRDDLAVHLPTDLAEDYQRIPVESGAELLAALNCGYDSWRAYRDHVLRVSGGGPVGQHNQPIRILSASPFPALVKHTPTRCSTRPPRRMRPDSCPDAAEITDQAWENLSLFRVPCRAHSRQARSSRAI